MACEEIVDYPDVEADRVLAPRQLVARREQNAVVVAAGLRGLAHLLLEVGPVLGEDRALLTCQKRKELQVFEPFEVRSLVDGDDVIAARVLGYPPTSGNSSRRIPNGSSTRTLEYKETALA